MGRAESTGPRALRTRPQKLTSLPLNWLPCYSWGGVFGVYRRASSAVWLVIACVDDVRLQLSHFQMLAGISEAPAAFAAKVQAPIVAAGALVSAYGPPK